MKRTATIILNRNLPKETDSLVEHLVKFDGNYTDIFVVEAGSNKDNLSKYQDKTKTRDILENQGLTCDLLRISSFPHKT